MAEEGPLAKRIKHSIISDHVYSFDFQELFSKHWHGQTEVKTDNLEVIIKPFRVCRVSNFLSTTDFMEEVKNELLDVKSRRNSIDLYQFEQTGDLATVTTPNLKVLYETFQTDFANWMGRNTKMILNNKISMSSSCYSDTDYLLCHDDNMEDRRIAFILYLSKNWTVDDGGALDLFDTDENGLPRDVVKSLVPEYNSLVFFEVLHNSYHQVAEVTSADKSRWSINGWFHGPIKEYVRPTRPELPINYIKPLDSIIDLSYWFEICYLTTSIVRDIQREMEKESCAFLANFIDNLALEKILVDICSDTITWNRVGPADLRNYEVADETTLPTTLKEFYEAFKSRCTFRLMKDYTELDLIPITEEMNPRMTIELQRWSKGCYTLIYDKSVHYDGTVHTDDESDMADDVHSKIDKMGITKEIAEKNEKNNIESFEKNNCAKNEVKVNTENNETGNAEMNCKASAVNDNHNNIKHDGRYSVDSNCESKVESNDESSGESKGESNDESNDESNCESGTENNDGKKMPTLIVKTLNTKRDQEDRDSSEEPQIVVKKYRKRHKTTAKACSTSSKEDYDTDEQNLNRTHKKDLKASKIPATFLTKLKKSSSSPKPSSSKADTEPPDMIAITLDTDDSDVSDIGDYLSDRVDYSVDYSEQEAEGEEATLNEPGALDVIIQFHTGNIRNTSTEEHTIDYIDPKAHEAGLIHIPPKDNHLSLVYRNAGVRRVHKYVNHYCKGYFYNLICTYYE